MSQPSPTTRRIVTRTRGRGHGGPMVRLMSPSDLGAYLKPFVFLDLVDAPASLASVANVHPHSGIATVTVIPEGDLYFHKPGWGEGTLDYGGVEWMRAGNGVWHGDEFVPGACPRFVCFQLWVALPPSLELSPGEWQFVEAGGVPDVGPARLILGAYGGARSPVRSFDGMNYLLVTLGPDEVFTYETPRGHTVGWLSLSRGELAAGERVEAGELIAFDRSDDPIPLRAGPAGATFVLGSAVPHAHDLVLGYYSVHTSAEALRIGEARIAEIRPSRSARSA